MQPRATATLVFALLLVSACGESSDPSAPGVPEWHVVLEDLDGAVLGFWGPSIDSLFAVGGRLSGDGGEGMALRYDGQRWYEMDVRGPSLWWPFGFAPDDVWAVGARGVIMHFDGAEWTTVAGGDEDYTLWGVWGASEDEMWAVGGSVSRNQPSVLLRYDGTSWERVEGVGRVGELLFKVWGSAADDVWVVGTDGAVLHWDGVEWTRADVPSEWRLVTVSGRSADDVYAVGGLGSTLLVHFDGERWSEQEMARSSGLMGVFADPMGPVLLSGFRGTVWMGEDGTWTNFDLDVDEDLHAAWGDGNGVYLVGGGNLVASGAGRGVIAALGDVADGPVVPW